MKKFLYILTMSLMIISMAACGSADTKKDSIEKDTEVFSEDNKSNSTSKVENSDKSKETKKSNEGAGIEARTYVNVSDELDKAVADAILKNNKGMYADGECNAEGHIIMDVVEDKTITTVYTLTTYGEYGFINGKFIKISGSGVIPVVINFGYDKESNSYILKNYEEPKDGTYYEDSIKELFPRELHKKIFSTSDSDIAALQKGEKVYAKNYLDSIGRTAEIGEYSDLERVIPDIDEKVYSSIFERYWEYPYWIGTHEVVEDGVRYVYETQWKDYGGNSSLIYFTKYVYDTGEIIRTINIRIDNGEISSSEENVLKIVENANK